MPFRDFAELVIGPATSGGTRWLQSALRASISSLDDSVLIGDHYRQFGGLWLQAKLRLHHLGKKAAALQQLIVRPGLDDAAVVEHQDARRVADGREPMCNDKGGAAFHHLVERRGDARLGHRVERAGGFVKNE